VGVGRRLSGSDRRKNSGKKGKGKMKSEKMLTASVKRLGRVGNEV